jgi:hypothetical protein
MRLRNRQDTGPWMTWTAVRDPNGRERMEATWTFPEGRAEMAHVA